MSNWRKKKRCIVYAQTVLLFHSSRAIQALNQSERPKGATSVQELCTRLKVRSSRILQSDIFGIFRVLTLMEASNLEVFSCLPVNPTTVHRLHMQPYYSPKNDNPLTKDLLNAS